MKTVLEKPRPKKSSPRYERLEARVSRELKQLFQEAADMRGVTLSDFLINSAHDAAVETVEQHKVIRLSREASLQFARALLRPPQSHPRRRAAARRYLQMMKGK
jgi:uncharacterized protein (DUF1778 family)